MVSFTEHYNGISIDRSPSKTKIGKDSWYFHKSTLCKSEFSSTTKKFHFFIESTINNNSSASDWWECTKSYFKKMLIYFLKTPPLKKILQFKYRI